VSWPSEIGLERTAHENVWLSQARTRTQVCCRVGEGRACDDREVDHHTRVTFPRQGRFPCVSACCFRSTIREWKDELIVVYASNSFPSYKNHSASWRRKCSPNDLAVFLANPIGSLLKAHDSHYYAALGGGTSGPWNFSHGTENTEKRCSHNLQSGRVKTWTAVFVIINISDRRSTYSK